MAIQDQRDLGSHNQKPMKLSYLLVVESDNGHPIVFKAESSDFDHIIEKIGAWHRSKEYKELEIEPKNQ